MNVAYLRFLFFDQNAQTACVMAGVLINTCFFLRFFDTDNSTVETLFGNMDAMQNVTALLDRSRKWKNVGQHYDIDQGILDNLERSDFQSPTKTVLEYIFKRQPTVTMNTFLRSLQNIDRYGVIDDLKEFFYGKIILPSLLKRTHIQRYLLGFYSNCYILPIIKKNQHQKVCRD